MSDERKTVFVIEDHGVTRRVDANGLTVAKNGYLRLWRDGKLAGVVKEGNWIRCYIEVPQSAPVKP